jgi:hypothetical protein
MPRTTIRNSVSANVFNSFQRAVASLVWDYTFTSVNFSVYYAIQQGVETEAHNPVDNPTALRIDQKINEQLSHDTF